METKTQVTETMQERLERLGLKTASKTILELKARKKKMMVAYEHYRFITPEKLQRFQEKLYQSRVKGATSYRQLAFTPLENYGKVPPEDVLVKLEEAMGRGCFDQFDVAHIVEVKIDPLLIGRIKGCKDLFHIAQWDTDVRIEDILNNNEG